MCNYKDPLYEEIQFDGVRLSENRCYKQILLHIGHGCKDDIPERLELYMLVEQADRVL